ncbi:MAG: YcfL family protein [Methylobacter sp.]
MHLFKNIPLAIVLSLLCACASHKPPPRPGSIDTKIEQLSEMLYLQVTDLRAVKRNHLLTVQAEINNSDSDNQQLYYRFKWLDANGFVVGEETWKPVLVYAYQKQTVTAVAPSPQVADFRLVVQSTDNTGQMP